MYEPITKFWETESRYYTAELIYDLLCDWTIYCNWGGKYNKRRGGMSINCDSYRDGIIKLKNLDRIRKNRKYKQSQI